jgi:glycoside/pentoside/hexuronide:cation symporter, GPH family
VTHGADTTYRVGWATKLAYSVGALSDSIKTFSFGLFLLFFYTTVMGLPGTWVGMAMSIGLVWDSVVDPVIGHWSDRATVRFGRRHSFMLVGAVCAGASFLAIFNPPAGLSAAALFGWLMASSLCLRSSNSLFMVPYYALGAELATDYHERTSISGFRVAGVLMGTMVAAAAAFLVFFPSVTSGVDSKFVPERYSFMGLVFGAAITLAGLVATLGTLKERPRLARGMAQTDGGFALRRSILVALRNRSFRVLVWSAALFFLATAINAALTTYFLTYHARVAANEAFTLIIGAFYAGALAGVVVWMHASRRAEKHRVCAAATLMTALVMSSGYWLVGEGRPFGTGNVPVLMIGNALAGFFASAVWVIVPSMLADVAADDERRAGRSREGVFFGIYSLGQQMSGGLAVLVAGALADRFAGLVPGEAGQSAETVDRLAMLSHVLPAIVLVAAGTVVLRYDLTRQHADRVDAGAPVSASLPVPASAQGLDSAPPE